MALTAFLMIQHNGLLLQDQVHFFWTSLHFGGSHFLKNLQILTKCIIHASVKSTQIYSVLLWTASLGRLNLYLSNSLYSHKGRWSSETLSWGNSFIPRARISFVLSELAYCFCEDFISSASPTLDKLLKNYFRKITGKAIST